MRRPSSVRVGLTLVAAATALLAATTGRVDAQPEGASAALLADAFDTQPWSTAFTATRARQLPANQIDFAGHPLDVTFDNSGRIWGIGEFGLQAIRANAAGTSLTKENLPLKVYLDDQNQILDWTKPFTSFLGGYGAGSPLAESVIRAGSTVWAVWGGEQNNAAVGNHSILVRYDPSTTPATACSIPLPGDNNEAIGLAYDASRGRVWFAQSEGDHRQASSTPYSTLGWVKVAGLGARCQNALDYGGDPRPTADNPALRAAAQATINSLQCTAAQESSATANCVHIVPGTSLPSGAAHLEYDATADALWITNWGDSKLRKYSMATGAITTYTPPAAPAHPEGKWPVAWQVAANATHVYVNEYNTSRLLRFTKSTGAWSVIEVPNNGYETEVHSIALNGSQLWFTVSDEDYDSQTALGYVDLASWTAAVKGVIYTGWSSLAMHPNQPAANRHSFRGIALSGNKIALADHGDTAYVTLTKK